MEPKPLKPLETEPERVIRALLYAEDPVLRVKSAFELARRLGRLDVSDIPVLEENVPGVQRHWMIILAGSGEYAALQALQKDSPHAEVRGHAYRLLVQCNKASALQEDNFHSFDANTQLWILEKDLANELDDRLPSVLSTLLWSSNDTLQRAAAKRLSGVSRLPNKAIQFCHEHPNCASPLTRAWLRSDSPTNVLEVFASLDRIRTPPSSRPDWAGEALLAIHHEGIRLPFEALEPHLNNPNFRTDLLELPPNRSAILHAMNDRLQTNTYLPPMMLTIASIHLSKPHSRDEVASFSNWEKMAMEDSEPDWWDDYNGQWRSDFITALQAVDWTPTVPL
jgi:hypothetical protein